MKRYAMLLCGAACVVAAIHNLNEQTGDAVLFLVFGFWFIQGAPPKQE